MSVADNLRKIREAAWAPMERMIEDAEELAEIRNAAKEQGLDWGPIKALLKARIQDERDGGERVKKLVLKADTASEYAEMLNFVADKQKTPPQSPKSKTAVSISPSTDSGEPASSSPQAPPPLAGGAGSSNPRAIKETAVSLDTDGGEPASVRRVVPDAGAGSLSHDPNDINDLRNHSFRRGPKAVVA